MNYLVSVPTVNISKSTRNYMKIHVKIRASMVVDPMQGVVTALTRLGRPNRIPENLNPNALTVHGRKRVFCNINQDPHIPLKTIIKQLITPLPTCHTVSSV